MSQKRSYELTEAISRLIMQQPFFAVLLLDLLSLSETDAIPTAGTNGKQLLVNPEWFGKLTLNERVFVICHEVMHVILEHPRRTKLYMDRGIGPDMKAFNPEKMNVAEDYIINDWVIHSGQNDMPKGGCLDPKFGYNDLADDVYCQITDPPPKDGQGGNTDGDGNWDTHLPESKDGSASHSKADLQRALKSAEASAKSQGKMPGSMQRLVDEMCESQVDWTEQLQLSVTTSAGRDDVTWARPNRKRLAMMPHIYLPGTCSHRAGTIVMYVDTSGSIGANELKHFFGEMGAIIDGMNPEHSWVGSCDSVAYSPHEMESGEELMSYIPEGGGGTHMPAIFEKLKEHYEISPDVLVILTDGYTDFGDQPPYDVIWVMTTDVVAPFGVSLHIKIGGEGGY